MPIPIPILLSGLRLPNGLPGPELLRSENDDVRDTLRPRGWSIWACEDSIGDDKERPRDRPASGGDRSVGDGDVGLVLGTGTAAVDGDGAAGWSAVMVVFGDGVRERERLRDLDRDLERERSRSSSKLTMTSGARSGVDSGIDVGSGSANSQ